MSEKPSLKDFLLESKVQTIVNQDDQLSDYIREMETYILRKGAGICDSEFVEISDHIDMLDAQPDKHPALEEQIEQAQNVFARCLPFILVAEKLAHTTKHYNYQ